MCEYSEPYTDRLDHEATTSQIDELGFALQHHLHWPATALSCYFREGPRREAPLLVAAALLHARAPESSLPRTIFLWEGHAVFQGAIFGFLLLFGTTSGSTGGGLFNGQSAFGADGRTSSGDELGFILATAVFLTVTAKLGLLTRQWTVVPAFVMFLCIVSYFGALAFLNVFMCPGRVCQA